MIRIPSTGPEMHARPVHYSTIGQLVRAKHPSTRQRIWVAAKSKDAAHGQSVQKAR